MKGFDPQALLAQANKMKSELARIQSDLKDRMVEGAAGNGAVTVVMNGLQEVQAVRLKKEAVDPEDCEMLEDLIVLAFKGAQEKARALSDSETKRATGGMGMPGMF